MPLLKIHTESVDHFFIVRLGFGPDVYGLQVGQIKAVTKIFRYAFGDNLVTLGPDV